MISILARLSVSNTIFCQLLASENLAPLHIVNIAVHERAPRLATLNFAALNVSPKPNLQATWKRPAVPLPFLLQLGA